MKKATCLVVSVLLLVALLPWRPALVQAQGSSALDEIQKRGTVRIGWSVWIPYFYRDSKTNKITGFSVELIDDLAKEMKVKTELVEDGAATLIAGLQARKYDMIMPMALTLPRALVVTYTDPLVQLGLGLLVPKKDVAKYRGWQDFDKPDKRLTTTLGSNVDLFVTRRFTQAQIIRAKAGPDSVMQVLTGRADAWANSYDAFHKVMSEHPDQLAIVPGQPYGASEVAFVVRQGDFVLQQWLNHFIREQKATGNLERLIQHHGLDKAFPAQ